MITADDLKILKSPFEPAQHEFLRGNTYITEAAINDRVEEVDPAWGFEILSTVPRAQKIIVTARMTIKGVARDGVGMETITMTKDGSAEANEAEKSAATDALKRCARLFGIGRYLLTLPDNIKDMDALARWLNGKAQPESNVLTITKIEVKKGQKKAYYETDGGLISDDFKLLVPFDANAELWSIEIGKVYALPRPAEAVFRNDKGLKIITAIKEWKQVS